MHLSLLALYALGGFLVSQGLMPIRILLSAIGFTFSLVFATQGLVQTLSDVRRVSGSLDRWGSLHGHIEDLHLHKSLPALQPTRSPTRWDPALGKPPPHYQKVPQPQHGRGLQSIWNEQWKKSQDRLRISILGSPGPLLACLPACLESKAMHRIRCRQGSSRPAQQVPHTRPPVPAAQESEAAV